MVIMLKIITWNLLALLLMMFTGWVISLVIRNVTIVDTLWGLGFVMVAWITFYFSEGYALRR